MSREYRFSKEEMGRRIGELIQVKKLNQKKLAELCGFGEAGLSRMIKAAGSEGKYLEKIDKICRELDTTPDYLMYGIEWDERCNVVCETRNAQKGIEIVVRLQYSPIRYRPYEVE